MQINCDSIIIRDVGVGRIVRETIVIIFIYKNIYILSIKQSQNRAAICLTRFLFHNQVVVVRLGICLGYVPVFYFQ